MRNEDREQWFKVKRVFLQQCKDTTCHYCQVLITQKNISVDHKHPIAKGGSVFDLNNLVLSCKRCNRFKSDYEYDYFVQNRDKIIAEYYQRQKELMARKAEAEKFYALNRNKDLGACFEPIGYEPDEEISIKKFRSDKVSLVRISNDTLEFNFAESFPVEREEEVKAKVKDLLSLYGTPVKSLKAYVDFNVEGIIFEVNHNFKVLVKFDTKEEQLLSKKAAAALIR